MNQMPSGILLASLTAPGVGKKAKMKGQWSKPPKDHTLQARPGVW